MKKLALILLTFSIAACTSNEFKDEELLRETARQDIIERLELPEGTEFKDESIEVSEGVKNEDGANVKYIVKVTIKSQNQEGTEIIKSHIMHYMKRADAEAAKNHFELLSFK